MDTNSGRFVGEDDAEPWMERLTVGEVVKIKGAELRVVVIEDRRVTLELTSAAERRFAAALLDAEPRNRAERRAAEALDRKART